MRPTACNTSQTHICFMFGGYELIYLTGIFKILNMQIVQQQTAWFNNLKKRKDRLLHFMSFKYV